MTGVVVKSGTPKAHSLASVSPCSKKKTYQLCHDRGGGSGR